MTDQSQTTKTQASQTKSSKFPKTHRLLTPAQFRHVFDKPERKLHAKHLMAFIRVNATNDTNVTKNTNDISDSDKLSHPRLGLAITKKKVPTAVARNRLKRIARDNFRLMAHELKAMDIVIIAKRPITELSNDDLHNEVRQILKKIRC